MPQNKNQKTEKPKIEDIAGKYVKGNKYIKDQGKI